MADCDKCGKKIGMWDADLGGSGLCGECRYKASNEEAIKRETLGANLANHLGKVGVKHLNIPCLTLQQFPGYRIGQTLGLVSGVAVMGANVFKDLLASLSDVVGGRSGSYEKSIKEGRKIATSEMQLEAHGLGANGILGASVDYETIGDKMMMVTVSGTAVVLEKIVK